MQRKTGLRPVFPEVGGCQVNRDLLIALASTCLAACGSPQVGQDRYFRVESDDLVTPLVELCNDCFYLQAMDTLIPIPTRFVPLSRRSEDGCLLLQSLGSQPEVTYKLRDQQDLTLSLVGSIQVCIDDVLSRRLGGDAAYVEKEWQHGRFGVTTYRVPAVNGEEYHQTVIRSRGEAVLIFDRNRELAEAITTFATANGLPFKTSRAVTP